MLLSWKKFIHHENDKQPLAADAVKETKYLKQNKPSSTITTQNNILQGRQCIGLCRIKH